MPTPRVTGSHSPSGSYSLPAPSLNSVEYGQAALMAGMQGEAVRQLQQALVSAGFPVQVDGKFGPQTLDAVKRFQGAHGLTVDGIVGEHTLSAFESSFSPARQNKVALNPQPDLPDAPVSTAPAGEYEARALKQNGAQFVARARQVAANIGVSPEALFAMMQNESGLRADAVNKGSNATGLIQFMPATARALGTTTDALKQMSATQQLDYVERYFRPYQGKIHSPADLYLACFYPAALGKSDDWVLGGQNGTAGAVARANPIFDLNKDQQITAGEFREYYRRRFPSVT